jgi:hypothetical protein
LVSEQASGVNCDDISFDFDDSVYRRAKAKLQNGKYKSRDSSAESPPDSPPELSTGYETDLHNLIHEDERKPYQTTIERRLI